MRPIGVIFNPFAKTNKNETQGQLDAIKGIFGNSALVRTTNSTKEIPAALKEFKAEGADVLGISGGDGTISTVITSYISLFGSDDLPLIIPLKGGTMNMIANDVGLKEDQIAICRKLVQHLKSGSEMHFRERGLIRVRDERLDHDNYTFSWIDGFLYRFIKWYRKEGASRGAALKLILKSSVMALTNSNQDLFKEVGSNVYVDDKKLSTHSHLFIAAISVKRPIFGFRLFNETPKAGETFNMLYMRLPYFKKVRYQIPRALYVPLESDTHGDFLNQSAAALTIEGSRGYVIDGEIYEPDTPTDVRLEAGPKVKICSFKK